MKCLGLALAGVTLLGLQADIPPAALADVPAPATMTTSDRLDDARRLFFNAQYEAAAALTRERCAVAEVIAACEVQTTALLFQLKRVFGNPGDKEKALKACVTCPALMAAFQASTSRGQALARAHLRLQPADEATLFLLSKLSLNHVWLHLGTLGQKTGWHEYWEARKTLDKLLQRNPSHIRARVARGWIDYIVDTKMPRGIRWLLGGGNKTRGLLAVREAASAQGEFFANAEARFALWDMQVRERQIPLAVATARLLARDFPENEELIKFLAAHQD